jgi:hypothetical protein
MVSRASFACVFDGLPGLKRWRLNGNGGVRLYWEGRSDSEEEQEEKEAKCQKRRRQEGGEEEGDRIGRQALLAVMKVEAQMQEKAIEEEMATQDREDADEWDKLLNM